ncbi:AUGMIN subunit 8-like [Iris pallida]|uniref:AUGMIN subunit 8-like n=1 Tax=Iris pallida TaxID=29817 RepID=A0AAX6DR57_IRIPA|nr:AUGMIN subunit 8-like [Iris pallida]
MDTCVDDPPGAVVLQKSFSTEEKSRPVFVTLEKNNAMQAHGKPQTREITSRYKLGITQTPRPSSPSARQTSPVPRKSVPQRAQLADRKRPSTPSFPSSRHSASSSPPPQPSQPSPSSKSSVSSSPSSRPSVPLSPSERSSTPVRDSMIERLTSTRRSLVGRAPDGLWPSMRSLSASFQSESSPVLSSKTDKAVRKSSPDRSLKPSQNAVSERKRTPLRGRNTSDQSENSRPVENTHTRVIEQLRWPAMMGSVLSSKSLDLSDKARRTVSSLISSRGISPTRRVPLGNSSSKSLQKSTSEAAKLVCSDGKEKVTPVTSLAKSVDSLPVENAPSGTRQSRCPSPVKHLVRPSSPNKALSTMSPTSRGIQSPTRAKPSTPFSSLSSTFRAMHSPSRTRPSTPCSPSSNATTQVGVSTSVLNYIADVQKGKKNASHMEDAHQLRLLYNRDLQWRFVNAGADAAFSTQKLIAEDMIYNVWNITSELRDSVAMKRINVQNLRREVQLNTILQEQIAYLEDWSALEREHSTSLSGAIEALKASTLRLPVTEGARADVRAVKNAISSAVDVMQAMGSSICYLLSRVEGTNCLVSELSEVASRERAMLDECRELLASTSAMQVQECSLRTNLIQLRQDMPGE